MRKEVAVIKYRHLLGGAEYNHDYRGGLSACLRFEPIVLLWKLRLTGHSFFVVVAVRLHSDTCPRQWPFNFLRRQTRDVLHYVLRLLNPLTPELNPSAQRCLTRFLTGDFASWTEHFVNICVKNHQIHQLFIQFINYVWQLLHVSALHCHLQGAFLVPSERWSIEEQSIEYCGWACCV
jgi:hypothetical protein